MEKPRVIFYGTTEFALDSLRSLFVHEFPVIAIVTSLPRVGRKGKRFITPVHRFGEEKGIPVLTPTALDSPEFLEEIKKYAPEIQVVVAFKILPESIFTLCPTFNIHASLLPKYRGAAPIEWAIMNGEKTTGVTTFLLDSGIDTGKIILQRKIEIKDTDTAAEISRLLAGIGAVLCVETIEMLTLGITPIEQEGSYTKAPKITKEIREIDWKLTAEEVYNKIRALTFHHPATSDILGRSALFLGAKITADEDIILEPGQVEIRGKQLFIGTGTKPLEILELQLAGKWIITAAEYINGYGKRQFEKTSIPS